MFGTVTDIEDGAIKVVVDGGTEAVNALTAKHYVPSTGDRVMLDYIGGRYIITYGVGQYVGISCAAYSRAGDHTSVAADYLPLNVVEYNNALPSQLNNGRIRINIAGLYIVDFRALFTGIGTVRARIARQDALNNTLSSGNWETVALPGMVHAYALMEARETDYISMWINEAFTVSGDSVQAVILKVR